jgi:hypothetical protein
MKGPRDMEIKLILKICLVSCPTSVDCQTSQADLMKLGTGQFFQTNPVNLFGL